MYFVKQISTSRDSARDIFRHKFITNWCYFFTKKITNYLFKKISISLKTLSKFNKFNIYI